jgi:hypothetical protein
MFQQTYNFVLVQTFFQLVYVSQQSDREHITIQEQQSFNFINEAKSKSLQPKVNISNKNYLKSRISTTRVSKKLHVRVGKQLRIYTRWALTIKPKQMGTHEIYTKL